MKVKYDEVGTVTVSGRVVLGLAATVVAVGAIGYGSYELFWDVKSNTTDRNAQIGRQNLAFQQSRMDEISRKLNEKTSLENALGSDASPEDVAKNKAQVTAIRDQICSDYGDLTTAYKNTLNPERYSTLVQLCEVQK